MMIRVIQNDNGDDEKVMIGGGCSGRLMIHIYIPPHTLHTYTVSCFQLFRSSLFSASMVILLIHLRSRFATPYMRCTSPVSLSSVLCCGFPLEVHLALLLVGFQLAIVAFPLSTSYPLVSDLSDGSSTYSSCFASHTHTHTRTHTHAQMPSFVVLTLIRAPPGNYEMLRYI